MESTSLIQQPRSSLSLHPVLVSLSKSTMKESLSILAPSQEKRRVIDSSTSFHFAKERSERSPNRPPFRPDSSVVWPLLAAPLLPFSSSLQALQNPQNRAKWKTLTVVFRRVSGHRRPSLQNLIRSISSPHHPQQNPQKGFGNSTFVGGHRAENHLCRDGVLDKHLFPPSCTCDSAENITIRKYNLKWEIELLDSSLVLRIFLADYDLMEPDRLNSPTTFEMPLEVLGHELKFSLGFMTIFPSFSRFLEFKKNPTS